VPPVTRPIPIIIVFIGHTQGVRTDPDATIASVPMSSLVAGVLPGSEVPHLFRPGMSMEQSLATNFSTELPDGGEFAQIVDDAPGRGRELGREFIDRSCHKYGHGEYFYAVSTFEVGPRRPGFPGSKEEMSAVKVCTDFGP
jgi:hypothetical protein